MSRAASERQLAQLTARVRDLEREVAKLKREAETHARAGFAELALAALVEGGDTIPDALTAVSSERQTIDSAVATLLEIVDESGVIKLKPIENASAGNRAKVTYWNVAKTQPEAWATAAQPMLLARLRDGRWIRLPIGGC